MDRARKRQLDPPRLSPWRCAVICAEALLAVTWSLGTLSSVHGADMSLYVQTLKSHGLEPTVESVGAYLQSLHPGPDARAQMAELVGKLGHDDFLIREAAMKQLLRMPVVAYDLLQQAVAGDDLEIRWRANLIQRHAESRAARVLQAALIVAHDEQLKGLAPQVLAAVPLCKEEYLLQAARQALQTTARPEDVELLLSALANPQRDVRIASIEALPVVVGAKAVADIRPLVDDRDDMVRVSAAVALANLGERDALFVFGKLLESEELRVRARSDQALRSLTSQNFNFVAYDKLENRAVPVKAWRDWLDAEGKTAKLDYPIKEARITLGRTLICYYGMNKVEELDAAGKMVWNATVMQPWGCQGLPNGHRLVASYNNSMVVEYDAEGKEAWRMDGLPGRPFSVERLDNGNTLVPYYSTNKIAEYSPDKKLVWEVNLDGNPMDAHRLADGNTLVCLLRTNSVVEIDREGKSVWTLDNMFGPRSAQRLENGNTLVSQTNGGKVVEVDRDKRVVWSKDGLNNPFDAQRLPNGNTLIVDAQGIREVDRDGKMIWEKQGGGVSRISRY